MKLPGGEAPRSDRTHCEKEEALKRAIFAMAVAILALTLGASVALAQSGHFVGTPTCTDIGTQLQCTGKVAGLGGTTFEITATASGTATVSCTNPAGNVAPGQAFTTTASGGTGEIPTPRNGAFRFSVSSVAPTAPAGACPNPRWTATVTDVEFGDATVTLLENGVVSDTITVPVS